MKKLLLLLFLLVGAVLAVQALPNGIQISDRGLIEVGPLEFGVMHFGPGWTNRQQRFHSQRLDQQTSPYRLKFTTADGEESRLAVDISNLADDTVGVSYTWVSLPERAIPTERLSLATNLPNERFAGRNIQIDGRDIPLPRQHTGGKVFAADNVQTLRIPLDNGALVIRGKFGVLIQDGRHYGGNAFSCELLFAPSRGKLNRAELSITMQRYFTPSRPLPLAAAANRTFADPDGRGWTGQGKENDLAAFGLRPRQIGGVQFQFERDSSRPAAIVLGSTSAEGGRQFPAAATLAAPPQPLRYLYMLHAFAWLGSGAKTGGEIIVTGDDGQTVTLPVTTNVHAADWHSMSPVPAGALVWTGSNPTAAIGLYLTRFDLPRMMSVARIEFRSSPGTVWMIAGVSASDEPIERPAEEPCILVPNTTWRPLADQRLTVPGSILDFSDFSDAPAGKYGPVIVRNGRFVFAGRPDRPVRFYGANLCFTANYLDRKYADETAERFVRMGYNSVRFHHYDGDISYRTGRDFAPDQLDKLDYLFAACKQRGLYVTIDLFTIRPINPAVVPELRGKVERIEMNDYKLLLPISDAAFADWADFARRLLTHRNPYTGMTWGEDPALFSICTVNEDGTQNWQRNPVIRDLYLERFAAWKKAHPERVAQFSEKALLPMFLAETQRRYFEKQRQFLHEIGVKSLLTDLNWYATPWLSEVRAAFDFVDNHQYHDHPAFPVKQWSLPFQFRCHSAVRNLASTPRDLMPTRIFGKPFTVTEFNYCVPNPYRAEGGLLTGAYAALQDWDGLYRFAWSHQGEAVRNVTPIGPFDIVNDPLAQLSEKLGIQLFLRGDAAPAPAGSAWEFNPTDAAAWLQGSYPVAFRNLGLRRKIGTRVGDSPLPSGVTRYQATPEATGPVVSDTGEITLDAAAGDFRVITPRTEGFALNSGKSAAGQAVRVTPDASFNLVGVTVRDRAKTIPASRRILIIHLTEMLNNQIRFASQQRNRVENWGKLPLLVRRGRVEIEIATQLTSPRLYRLDPAGNRLGEQPFTLRDGRIRFTSDAAEAPAYELTGER